MTTLICKEACNRRFGLEIEVTNSITKRRLGSILNLFEDHCVNKHEVIVTKGAEGWANTVDNNYWHVKFDRSCGWELASYIGSGMQDIEQMSCLAPFLAFRNVKVDNHCALHIHAETADFSVSQMDVLLAYWLKIEPILFEICQPHRTNNIYCKSLRSKWDREKLYNEYYEKCESNRSTNIVWECLRPRDLHLHGNNDKKVALNSVGFATAQVSEYHSRNTVELRMPECKLDYFHVKFWLLLFLNFVDSTRTKNRPENLQPCKNLVECLNCLSLSGMEENFILDPNLTGTKIWFLSNLIKYSKSETLVKEAQQLLQFITLI